MTASFYLKGNKSDVTDLKIVAGMPAVLAKIFKLKMSTIVLKSTDGDVLSVEEDEFDSELKDGMTYEVRGDKGTMVVALSENEFARQLAEMSGNSTIDVTVLGAATESGMLLNNICLLAACTIDVSLQNDATTNLIKRISTPRFQAALVQTAQEISASFHLAEDNMSAIHINLNEMPSYLIAVIGAFTNPSDPGSKVVMETYMKNVGQVSARCVSKANEVVMSFASTLELVREMVVVSSAVNGVQGERFQQAKRNLAIANAQQKIYESQKKTLDDEVAQQRKRADAAYKEYQDKAGKAGDLGYMMGAMMVDFTMDSLNALKDMATMQFGGKNGASKPGSTPKERKTAPEPNQHALVFEVASFMRKFGNKAVEDVVEDRDGAIKKLERAMTEKAPADRPKLAILFNETEEVIGAMKKVTVPKKEEEGKKDEKKDNKKEDKKDDKKNDKKDDPEPPASAADDRKWKEWKSALEGLDDAQAAADVEDRLKRQMQVQETIKTDVDDEFKGTSSVENMQRAAKMAEENSDKQNNILQEYRKESAKNTEELIKLVKIVIDSGTDKLEAEEIIAFLGQGIQILNNIAGEWSKLHSFFKAMQEVISGPLKDALGRFDTFTKNTDAKTSDEIKKGIMQSGFRSTSLCICSMQAAQIYVNVSKMHVIPYVDSAIKNMGLTKEQATVATKALAPVIKQKRAEVDDFIREQLDLQAEESKKRMIECRAVYLRALN